MADALARLEQVFDQNLVTRFRKACRSALPLCTAPKMAPMHCIDNIETMSLTACYKVPTPCDADLTIQTFIRLCNLVQPWGVASLNADSAATAASLAHKCNIVNMARATWKWL